MVSVYRTSQGWSFASNYYTDLGSVMAAAYEAEKRQGHHLESPELRDRPCHNCRFAAGS